MVHGQGAAAAHHDIADAGLMAFAAHEEAGVALSREGDARFRTGSGAPAPRTLPTASTGPGRMTKLARVAAYVDGMLHRPDLTVRTIALAVGVSRSVLYRHFAAYGGIARFVRDRRMAALQRAMTCPRERRSFADIARACGYASASHASRRFKSCFGVTPGAYRRLARARTT